ncbi:MAG TPA: glycosyltransferase family 2 protein [Gammaproteobacteria bacterium]|nr:glycosyltransferase family 2 protein [Gammaproteobacteria bacterium]
MAAANIAVLILTYNEQKHIERCINSIKNIASDIVVIDSFSTDDTVALAESLGARVLQNSWTNHAVQIQWGLDHANITSNWVMRIDADEYLESEPEMVFKELSSLPAKITGLIIKRKIFFLGQWMKYGAIYPVYTLRIWRNGAGRVENRWMDEHIVLMRGEAKAVDIDIVDDNINSISWWIDKHNSYATKEMIEILNQKYHFMPTDDALSAAGSTPAKSKRLIKERIYNKLPIFIRPMFYFFYRYIFKLGFLDRTKGFAFHFMQGYWYRTLVDLKVLEAEELIGMNSDPVEIKRILAEHTGLDL